MELTVIGTESSWEPAESWFPLFDTTLHCSPRPPRLAPEKSESRIFEEGSARSPSENKGRSSAYSEGQPVVITVAECYSRERKSLWIPLIVFF